MFTFKTYNSQHSLHHPVLVGKPLCVLAIHFPVLFTNTNVVNRVVAPGGAPKVLSPLAVCSWCFWEYRGYPLGLLVHRDLSGCQGSVVLVLGVTPVTHLRAGRAVLGPG